MLTSDTNGQVVYSVVPNTQFNEQSNNISSATSVVPTIQNTPIVPEQNVIYTNAQTTAQPQIVYTRQQQITNQPQPQANQTNSLVANLANKFVSNLEQQLKDKTVAQTNAQQVSSAANTIQQQMVTDAGQKLTNIYEGQKKAEEDKQKEFERLKEENERFKKEEEARKQKEENDKKLEDERSEIKNQQQELDEREDFITSMEKNALINKDEFDKDIEQIDIAKDTKAFGQELDILYEQQLQMNAREKEQKSKLISDIDKEIYRDAEKLDKLNEKLNRTEAGKSLFVKIINFITGRKDKQTEKIKEDIKKLSEKIEKNTMTIEEKREELKKIENAGMEIWKNRSEDMSGNSKSQIEELKASRKQYDEIVNSEDYKNSGKKLTKDYLSNIRKRTQERIDLMQSMAKKRNEDIYSKYSLKKQINNNKSQYSKETVNQKKGYSYGSAWLR